MKNKSDSNWQAYYEELIAAGISDSTRRAYRRDVAYFWVWAKLVLGISEQYPVEEESVIRFALDHLGNMEPEVEDYLIQEELKRKKGPLKISTLRRYVISISIANQEAGMDSPTSNQKIRLLLRRARRATANQATNKKAAITKDILVKILNTCNDRIRGVRDRAILLVGFSSGGRRRSEIVRLQYEDLTKIDSGYILKIRKSKTDQGGHGFEVPIMGSAATALNAWLVKSGIRSGYLFRSIRNNGTINDGMTGQSINMMVKKRIALIGLDPKKYGAHSLRSGFITESARSGASLADAMGLSGHRTFAIANEYYRQGEISDNPAGKLIE